MANSSVVYVFDTSSFIVMENYYPEQFPTFWSNLTELAVANRIQSVSEVWKELNRENTRDFLVNWIKDRQEIFPTPDAKETKFVAGIFAVPAFQALVKQKARLKGSPVADPWVIARAAQLGATLVTEESQDPALLRIPKVCTHFNVASMNVQGLLAQEGWKY